MKRMLGAALLSAAALSAEPAQPGFCTLHVGNEGLQAPCEFREFDAVFPYATTAHMKPAARESEAVLIRSDLRPFPHFSVECADIKFMFVPANRRVGWEGGETQWTDGTCRVRQEADGLHFEWE